MEGRLPVSPEIDVPMPHAYIDQPRYKNLLSSRSFQLLFMASVFSLLLTCARIWHTDSLQYIFLVWNLFLAAIPWLISRFLRSRAESDKAGNKAIAWTLRLTWLIFLPNAPYIITDLYHIRYASGSLLWYDVLLILTYAWTGLLFGLISIRDMEVDLRKTIGSVQTKVLIPVILFLCSFGIYIGRFQRWNSWDLLTEPQHLMTDVLDLLLNPMTHPRAWGVTLLMGIFLNLIYWSLSALRPESATSKSELFNAQTLESDALIRSDD